ncbi:MAG: TolC family protein, partial [Bacteroidota bacterium]
MHTPLNKNKNFFFILLMLISSPALEGQTMNALVKIALEENLKLKTADLQYQAAWTKPDQVSQLPDPEVSLGAFILPVETRLGAQLFRVGVSQMLPQKGYLNAQKDLAIAKAKSIYTAREASTYELIYKVKKSYLMLYELKESQRILNRNIDLFKSLERFALTKVASGQATAADALRAQLRIKALEQQIIELNGMEVRPQSDLNHYLNQAYDNKFILLEKLELAQVPFAEEDLMASFTYDHPLLAPYQQQEIIVEQAIKVNEQENKPALGFGFDYFLVNGRSDANPSNNGRDIVQLRGSVKIPLHQQRYRAKNEEEQIKKEILQNQKEDLKHEMATMLKKAFADYETAVTQYTLYEEQLVIVRAAINILQS